MMGTKSHRAQPHKTSLVFHHPFCSQRLNKIKFKQKPSSPTAALYPWEFPLNIHLSLLPFAGKNPSPEQGQRDLWHNLRGI